jgi:hypothetical protein
LATSLSYTTPHAPSVRSAACRLYSAIAEERKLLKQYHRDELNPEVDWVYSMPWLFYNGAQPPPPPPPSDSSGAWPPAYSTAVKMLRIVT